MPAHKYIAKVRTKTGKIRYIYKEDAPKNGDESNNNALGPLYNNGLTRKKINRQGLKFQRSEAKGIYRPVFKRTGAKKIERPGIKFGQRKAKPVNGNAWKSKKVKTK